jgi:import inner membrane translocase subunit TIM50
MYALRLAAKCPARRPLVQQQIRALASKPPKRRPSPPEPTPEPSPPVVEPTPAGLPTLDFSPSDEPSQSGKGRTGAKSSKDSLSSIEQRRRYLGRVSLGLLAVGLGLYTVSLGGEWTAEELKEKRLVSIFPTLQTFGVNTV